MINCMITASIILDSISSNNKVRLTTYELTYPRYIHSEFMTHRMFSRNASSSRAIPISKIIEEVKTNPVVPVEWGKNQKGMQARELLSDESSKEAKDTWLKIANETIHYAEKLQSLGVHKQIVNRLLEPYSYIKVICTATEYQNFFKLRAHEDAQPEIRILAEKMLEAYNISQPKLINNNSYHLPYVTAYELASYNTSALIKCSIARCARVSYKNHDGTNNTLEQNLQLYDRLLSSRHLSPFEHVAKPDTLEFHANFYGWKSIRRTIPGEYIPR